MRPYELLRLPTRAMCRAAANRMANLPIPRDEPSCRSGDERADRFLLIGNGRCSGWGVTSHRLALTGSLSRALTAATGRSVDVDFIGGDLLRIGHAVDWVGERARSGYRGALVMMVAGDALRLTPVKSWRRDLIRLVERLDEDLPPGAPLFLATLPSMSSIAHALEIPSLRAFDRHAALLNQVIREVAGTVDRVVLVDDAEAGCDPRDAARASEDYRLLGKRLAATIGPVLSSAPSQPRSPLRAPSTWSAKAAAFASDGDGAGPLRAIVEEAAARFDVWSAHVTILDGENAWLPASSGTIAPYLPRDLTICEWTVAHDDTLVITDAGRDGRVRDNPLRRQWGLQFYAGHPVRDAGGTTIGAFCIADTRNRDFSEVDVLRLQTFARRVELHLHALEREIELTG